MQKNIFEEFNKKSSVFKDRNALTPHFIPKNLPFREKQIKQLAEILKTSLEGQKPDNIFLYGKTGTGKTTTTKHVLKQLQEYTKKKQNKIKTIYMNCRNYNSNYKAMAKAVQIFYPENNFIGYSRTFIYEKMISFIQKQNLVLIIALDEIDRIKDPDDLVYNLTRANDELEKGAISIIGISNQLTFKDLLDPRTKSSLCEKEFVFPPYNAKELKEILRERTKLAFHSNIVQESAISLAAAIAAKESGDARTAVLLLLRAGEIAEKEKQKKITDKEVEKARAKVEEDAINNMVSSMPEQEQLVLYAIAKLTAEKKGMKRLSGKENILFTGEIYEEYQKIVKKIESDKVSSRWFQNYINNLELYGLIVTTPSGKGVRGNTKLIKLVIDPNKTIKIIKKTLK